MENNSVSKFDVIKKINRSLVLDRIKSTEMISRTEIAKDLKLSKATVSAVVEELLARQLVEEVGKGESTQRGGKRRSMLRFNPKSKIGIGVDIGGTKIQIIMTDLIGDQVYEKRVEATNNFEEIIELIELAIIESKVDREQIIALGAGIPGFTNPETGIVFDAPALQWNDINVRESLQNAFPFPVFINNDVNCAALGERWLGSGDKSDDMFFIAIGTGIGSAIISNGKLVYGTDYKSGEIGYQISKKDIRSGYKSKPGMFGLFEQKASGEGLRSANYTAKELFREYENQHSQAVEIINNFIDELVVVIVNSINLLNPEKVIIGGGVSESMGTVLPHIQSLVNQLTPIKSKIELASLSSMAGAIGAVNYAYQELEENNLL